VMCPHEMHVLKLVEFSSMLQGQSKWHRSYRCHAWLELGFRILISLWISHTSTPIWCAHMKCMFWSLLNFQECLKDNLSDVGHIGVMRGLN
jgi:hypothetical protein